MPEGNETPNNQSINQLTNQSINHSWYGKLTASNSKLNKIKVLIVIWLSCYGEWEHIHVFQSFLDTKTTLALIRSKFLSLRVGLKKEEAKRNWYSSFPWKSARSLTVKILKIGTPEIITIIVLQLEQLDFTVQYCVQKMLTE